MSRHLNLTRSTPRTPQYLVYRHSKQLLSVLGGIRMEVADRLRVTLKVEKPGKLLLAQVEYPHLLELIRQCRNNGYSRKWVNTLLRIVQLYCKYQKQEENPAIGLYIKGEVRRIHHDLIDWEALEELHHWYPAQLSKPNEAKPCWAYSFIGQSGSRSWKSLKSST